MKFRLHAMASAVCLAAPVLFSSLVLANTEANAQIATVQTSQTTVALLAPAPVISTEDVTDTAQPNQTTQEVIQAAEAKVQDAMADVDHKAKQIVRQQTEKFRLKGRRDIRIMYGTALVKARPSEGKWGDARVIAYQKAVMSAREKLLKQLYADVATEMVRESFKTNQLPEISDEELRKQAGLEGALDMLVAIADTALDGRVEKMGIDGKAYVAASPSKRKIMMKKAFSKTTSRLSRGELGGTIVTKTFETTDENGNTAISVVLTTSNKMKNTLQDLRLSKGNIQPDPRKARISIEQYLEKNKSNLMYQYGLNLMHDELGYPVLISYAQAGNDCNPVDYEECIENREFSFIEAENDAFSNFAEAYQLTGKLQTESTRGEEKIKDATITRGDEGTETVEGTVSRIIKETREMSRQTSSVKGLVGIKETLRWTEKHPVTGKEINGIVLTWHPVNEQSIRNYKANKPKPRAVQQQSATHSSNTSNQGAGMDTFNADDF